MAYQNKRKEKYKERKAQCALKKFVFKCSNKNITFKTILIQFRGKI